MDRIGVQILLAVYLVMLMISLGSGMQAEPKGEKKAKRRLLVRGLLFELLLLPVLAWGLVEAMHLSGGVAVALLLVSVAPGGRYAPHFARLVDGNVPIAVELTLFLAKITTFTAPLAAGLLLHSHRLDVRELPLIAQLLLLQFAPLYVGKWLRRRKPAVANRIEVPLRRAATVTAFLLIALIAIAGGVRGFRLLGDRGWLAVLAFAALATTAGWLLGYPREPTRRVFAISAIAPNGALALILGTVGDEGALSRLDIAGVWLALVVLDLILVGVLRSRNPVSEPRGPWARPVGQT
jgi:BASS family bile acid:Na+ symporter